MVKRLDGVDMRELSEAYQKVLAWFFAFPQKEMSLNDLVEELSISKTTANRVVEALIEEGFLKRSILGRTWRLTCDQRHVYNLSRKVPGNLQMIYESGVVAEIKRQLPSARAVVLFGSYRKGDDTEQSDIDIAVEVLDDDESRIIRFGVLQRLGYRTEVPVNLHVFSRNRVDLNLFANIANGIVLEGFLEVRP